MVVFSGGLFCFEEKGSITHTEPFPWKPTEGKQRLFAADSTKGLITEPPMVSCQGLVAAL